MNIHEHQAKEILSRYGVAVPQGKVAFSSSEARLAAEALQSVSPVMVVKAQIHSGGRGQAGGIKLERSVEGVFAASQDLLGKVLVTKQTGPEGKVVRRLYVEAGSDIKKEYYLSLLVDRDSGGLVFIASTEGGMDIEEVAHSNPEKIIKVKVDPTIGLQGFHERKLAFALGFSGEQLKKFSVVVKGIYKAFMAHDASQIEINPLIETKNSDFIALDAKMNFDSNALFRQPEIVALHDETEEDPLELEAKKFDLNYIKMSGNIGCMVNGAGLAMATMDIIKLFGGEPANFLDVGGGATKERVTEAFKIILSDSNVKAILVNIFGGIMRCDIIADGVISAAKAVGINVPVVVRLEGTNAEKGRAMLQESGLNLVAASDLADAATKVVTAIK
jgi:succinyl-CoA synthetase beta subunit